MPEDKKSYKINNIIERSDKTQEILTYIPKWIIRSGITILAIIIVSFIVLSKFIKYPDVITSVITLRSDNPPSLYFANEDNSKYDFVVTNGQKVVSGQTLAITNKTDTLFADIEGIMKISTPSEPLNTFAKDELVFNIMPEKHDRVFGTIKLNLPSAIGVDVPQISRFDFLSLSKRSFSLFFSFSLFLLLDLLLDFVITVPEITSPA